MQLRVARPARVAGLLGLLCLVGAPVGAEDRITVHGAYYREPSTRVIQPMVQVTKDLPAGFDVDARYLIDAITSASIAQGNVQDNVLSEKRHEVRLEVGKTFAETRLAVFYRHSQEPDYVSSFGGWSLTQGVWDKTGTLLVNGAAGHDFLRPNTSFKLTTLFGGAAYEQALSPTTVAQVGYDFTWQDGFLANQYLRHPSLGREKVPTRRQRHAFAARIAQYIPAARLGLQFHYRFYLDGGRVEANDPATGAPTSYHPWGMTAHTIEGRVYQQLGRDVEVRLSYRYHTQGAADFWCNSLGRDGGNPACYGTLPAIAPFYSVDVKFGGLKTHYPELKVVWELRIFQGIPFFSWFAPGAAEASYGRFFQSTYYGDAHVLQVGYSLPY